MAVAGRTEQMRTEHREIRRIADELDTLPMTDDRAPILKMFDWPIELMTLFRQHFRREEAVVYPLGNSVSDPAEDRELLSLVQGLQI